MSFHEIQEWVNTKTGLVAGGTALGAGNTIHLWLESATPILIFCVHVASLLYLTSMVIINIPKMIKVLSSPFRKNIKK